MISSIMWAGPWNERSAITALGVAIVAELTRLGHAVQIVRTELGASAALPPPATPVAPIRFWRDVSVLEMRRDIDAVIVNFGDSYDLHGAMLENFADAGAVGIFHDASLANLASSWAEATSPDPYAKLRRMVETTYGPRAKSAVDEIVGDERSLLAHHTMIEWFANGLCGAIVHGDDVAPAVRSACPGPAAAISPRTNTAAQYVQALIAFIESTLPARPVMLAGQALGQTLASFGIGPDDPAVNNAGMVLSEMVGNQHHEL